MRIDLEGSTALVTGSTQGIGLAIATGLAAAGARVAINGRSESSVQRGMAEVRSTVPNADLVPLVADISTEAGSATVVETLPQVDILVNNLGIFGAKPVLEIDDEEWKRYFDVNVLTAVRLTRLYDSAIVIPTEMVHYGVSKTALLGVSRGYAKEAAGTGVTVNSVIAGPTHTKGVEDFVYELVDPALPWDEAQHEFMLKHRPQSLLQRLIEPEEIANMVVYLSSRFASATTGAAVRVDGGYVDSIVP
jgi:NAD(P)-dependent dehydrogenase (short-subunit alcohol dehydrogenase family)